MQASILPNLSAFNRMALHYQDEVFTLAYYLLGDEAGASEAVQSAFEAVYQRAGGLGVDRFRRELMRSVLTSIRKGHQWFTLRGKGQDEVSRQLMVLKNEVREAAILVDVLGLTYDEAADILGCSQKQAARLVAQARLDLSRQRVSQL